MLNEEDVLFGLWKRRGAADETRAALSCIQHGLLQAGQDHLLDAICKAANGAFPPPTPGMAVLRFWVSGTKGTPRVRAWRAEAFAAGCAFVMVCMWGGHAAFHICGPGVQASWLCILGPAAIKAGHCILEVTSLCALATNLPMQREGCK